MSLFHIKLVMVAYIVDYCGSIWNSCSSREPNVQRFVMVMKINKYLRTVRRQALTLAASQTTFSIALAIEFSGPESPGVLLFSILSDTVTWTASKERFKENGRKVPMRSSSVQEKCSA